MKAFQILMAIKRRLFSWILVGSIFLGVIFLRPAPVSADIFGGDVAVLTQILVQAIQQLNALNSLLSGSELSIKIEKA